MVWYGTFAVQSGPVHPVSLRYCLPKRPVYDPLQGHVVEKCRVSPVCGMLWCGVVVYLAHPSGCARCGAGADCSAINYQSLWSCTLTVQSVETEAMTMCPKASCTCEHLRLRGCASEWGLGCRVGCRVRGAEFRFQGSRFSVQGSGFRVHSGFRVQSSGFRVQGSGFRVGTGM
jgi:hypothetical protein